MNTSTLKYCTASNIVKRTRQELETYACLGMISARFPGTSEWQLVLVYRTLAQTMSHHQFLKLPLIFPVPVPNKLLRSILLLSCNHISQDKQYPPHVSQGASNHFQCHGCLTRLDTQITSLYTASCACKTSAHIGVAHASRQQCKHKGVRFINSQPAAMVALKLRLRHLGFLLVLSSIAISCCRGK